MLTLFIKNIHFFEKGDKRFSFEGENIAEGSENNKIFFLVGQVDDVGGVEFLRRINVKFLLLMIFRT